VSEQLVSTQFSCNVCHEWFRVPQSVLDDKEKLDDAVAEFMVTHVDRHGGDPQLVTFTMPFEGSMMRCTQ
jgi:hypothetical protein